jgi:hypothetical protein
MTIKSEPSRSLDLFASHPALVSLVKPNAQSGRQTVIFAVLANDHIRRKIGERFDDQLLITPAEFFNLVGGVSRLPEA